MDAIRELSKRIPITVRRARSLRQTQTPAERSLWNILRNRRFHGCKFRRQASIGPFIVDFYCPEYRLIVEVDGSIHDTQRGLDQWRQRKIEHDGYTVLRFTNAQILLSAENVLVEIVRFIDAA
ncbi:MAG: endonuclease domain-containing protein [Candidatus Peribacteraceae bacterium]|nr:endonuclease domain-containing protein [Candidatus Peribacteraceae bacterium]MDD5739650.1 endonuclease domain-containing protein [Candidatus Peribacteraceae bacterium]